MKISRKLLRAIASYLLLQGTFTFGQSALHPPQLGMVTGDAVNTLSSHSAQYKYDISNRFILGWNWGSAPCSQIDSSLHINTTHGVNRAMLQSLTDGPQGQNVFAYLYQGQGGGLGWKMNLATMGRNVPGILNTISLTAWPSLSVDSTQDFAPLATDTCGKVFGFYNRSTGSVGTGINENYLMLAANGNYDQLVLSNVWNGSLLKMLDFRVKQDANTLAWIYDTGTWDPEFHMGEVERKTYDELNGTNMVFTMDLKYYGEPLTPSNADDIIAYVEIPFYGYDGQNAIEALMQFDSLPNPTVTIDNIYADRPSPTPQYRGSLVRMYAIPSNQHKYRLNVTRKMIATLAVGTPVTIAASLTLHGRDDLLTYPHDNYMLYGEQKNNPHVYCPQICKIDMQLYYNNNADIAVGKMRLSSRRYYNISWGRWDRRLADSIATVANDLADVGAINISGAFLSRYYSLEECGPSRWDAMRYFNKLVGGNAITELSTYNGLVASNSPIHFLTATGHKEYYNGNTLGFSVAAPAPYLAYGSYEKRGSAYFNKTLGLMCGFRGIKKEGGNVTFANYANSQYETYISPTLSSNGYPYNFTDLQGSDYALHDNDRYVIGLQTAIEARLYNGVYMNRSLLYSGKPWYANLWLCNETWDKDSNNSGVPILDNHRPLTGEEARLCISEAIALGAKGLLYYSKITNDNFATSKSVMQGIIQSPPLLNGSNSADEIAWANERAQWNYHPDAATNDAFWEEHFAKDEIMGSDYLPVNDVLHHKFGLVMQPGLYSYSDLSTDYDHIYSGQRSVRWTIARMHRWVHDNEVELVNMKILGWYGKGFITMKTQSSVKNNSGVDVNIFENLVRVNGLKTRPVDRVDASGAPFYETSDIDSSFIDVTIHQRGGASIEDEFYVAVVNRRTDPLMSNTSYAGGDLVFVPAAELDELCQHGGAFWKYPSDVRTAAWWRDMRRHQHGAREVTLPFYVNPDYLADGRNIQIHELKSTNESAYDTIVSYDSRVRMILEPGQMRVFHIKRLTTTVQTANVASIDNNGQTKIVGYPIFTGMQLKNGILQPTYSSNNYRYYTTYFKEVADVQNPLSHRRHVFVRYSNVVDKSAMTDLQTAAMQWNNEIDVTTTILDNANPLQLMPDLDCAYPALTVRFDSVAQMEKVYIVFSCIGTAPVAYTGANDHEGFICETITNENGHYDAAYVIAKFRWPDYHLKWDPLPVWGTPTIGSVSDGQFIAYSDRLSGVVLGWQPANVNILDPKVFGVASVKWDSSTSLTCTALHPSLASYSELVEYQNELPLVWDELCYYDKGSVGLYSQEIMYTRLSYDNVSVRKVLPSVDVFNDVSRVNGIGNILKITTQDGRNQSTYLSIDPQRVSQKPVVLNAIHKQIRPNVMSVLHQLYCPDIVAWEGRLGNMKTVDVSSVIKRIDDRTYQIDKQVVGKIDKLVGNAISVLFDYSEPQLGQGCGNLIAFSGAHYMISDSMAILDVTQTRNFGAGQSGTENGPYFTEWRMNGYGLNMATRSVGILNRAKPHITQLPFWESDYTYNSNARLLHKTGVLYSGEMYGDVFSNTSALMKNGSEGDCEPMEYCGYTSDSSTIMISPLRLSSGEKSKLSFLDNSIEHRIICAPDTIVSSWFRVGRERTVSYLAYGNDSVGVAVYIQKRGLDSILNIAKVSRLSSFEIMSNWQLSICNGGDEQYRLIFLPLFKEARSETNILPTLCDAWPVLDKRSDIDGAEMVVDLTNYRDIPLSIVTSPSPCDSYVKIQIGESDEVTHDGKYQVALYDNMSTVVKSIEMGCGDSIELETDALSSGVYYIVATQIRSGRVSMGKVCIVH